VAASLDNRHAPPTPHWLRGESKVALVVHHPHSSGWDDHLQPGWDSRTAADVVSALNNEFWDGFRECLLSGTLTQPSSASISSFLSQKSLLQRSGKYQSEISGECQADLVGNIHDYCWVDLSSYRDSWPYWSAEALASIYRRRLSAP
jgi:hypothetical protein